MTLRGKAAVLDRPNGTFTIEEFDVPEPVPGGMLIRQELCGICGTDAYMARGHLPNVTFPLVLGHEMVGSVEQLGEGVTEDYTGRPLSLGDRVYIAPGIACRTCYYCAVLRQPTLCLKRRGYGFRPQKDQPPHFQGGFSQFIDIIPGSVILKMAADAKTASVLEPLTIGIHQVERARIEIGATVVIQGVGAIGILTLAAAKQAGAQRIIVVGAPQTRLDLAKEYGADVTINLEEVPDVAERVAQVRAETPGGYGADFVFECAGVPAAIPEGLDMLRRGGTFVEAGHYTDHGDIAVNPFRHFVNKQITLVGAWGADTPHFIWGRGMIESGRFPFADLVSHTVSLERLADGIAAIGTTYRFDGEEIRKIAVAAHA